MHNSGSPAGPPKRFYARARNRVRASVADSMVYGFSLLALLLFIEIANVESGVGVPLFWMWVASAVAYEPVLVRWRGATLGHTLYNLYVVDATTGRPPSLPRAVARTWLKALLGLVSFAWMALTRRHQALHDLVTGTLVEVSDLSRARPDDVLEERPAEALASAVPVWRRVLVILAAITVSTVVFVVALAAMGALACPAGRCPPAIALAERIGSLVWLAALVACIVFGWRGQLPGARV